MNKNRQNDGKPPAPEEAPRKGATTLTTAVYRELRADIVGGRLKPGARLRVEELCRRFAIASSPVREALNRLVTEGFVRQEEQKGFSVAPVSRDELRELVTARCWIDKAAVVEAIAKRDAPWEEGLVVALHRLSRISRWATSEPPTPDPEWERLHREFHVALVAGCGSRWIMRISEQLFDAAERYRLLGAAEIPERHELDEHRAIVDACIAHDAQRAADLIEAHYGKTFDVIMGSANAPDR